MAAKWFSPSIISKPRLRGTARSRSSSAYPARIVAHGSASSSFSPFEAVAFETDAGEDLVEAHLTERGECPDEYVLRVERLEDEVDELRTENERLEGEIEALREEKLDEERFKGFAEFVDTTMWQNILEEIEART